MSYLVWLQGIRGYYAVLVQKFILFLLLPFSFCKTFHEQFKLLNHAS